MYLTKKGESLNANGSVVALGGNGIKYHRCSTLFCGSKVTSSLICLTFEPVDFSFPKFNSEVFFPSWLLFFLFLQAIQRSEVNRRVQFGGSSFLGIVLFTRVTREDTCRWLGHIPLLFNVPGHNAWMLLQVREKFLDWLIIINYPGHRLQ